MLSGVFTDQLEDANSSKLPYVGGSPYPTEAEKSHYQNQQFPTTHYTVTASLSTGTAEHEFHNPGKQQRDVDDDDDSDGQDGSSLGHDYQNDQFHHYHDEQHDGPNRGKQKMKIAKYLSLGSHENETRTMLGL